MIRPTDLLLDTTGDVVDQLRVRNEQTINDAVVALGITADTEVVKEPLNSGNAVTLANGLYGGWTSTKDASIYKGMGASSRVQRKVTVEADCIFDGIHFLGSDTNKLELVHIKIGNVAVFRSCIFQKRQNDSGFCVSLDATAVGPNPQAIFIGCVFLGPDTGVVINNPGGVADVYVIGCREKTGGGYGNVSSVGSF